MDSSGFGCRRCERCPVLGLGEQNQHRALNILGIELRRMPIQIGQKPESDFDNPLGLLSDCHRRIEHFLDVLVRVSESAAGRALSAEERHAFETALAYFRNSAPKHTADEEESLFPRMRATGASVACLDVLEADHLVAGRDHELVDGLGGRWLQGKLEPAETLELSEALSRLSGIYRRHIAVEDTELFPLAARVLAESELADVGREMAARRGV